MENNYSDLTVLKEIVFDKCNFVLTNYIHNKESQSHGACSFLLNGHFIQYRISKLTPIKIGQFVTVWKRNQDGLVVPFEISDDIDFIIIASISDANFGLFIFPKSVLVNKGIITSNRYKGKCGIRVYPPWDLTSSKQALRSQAWQIEHFFPINRADTADFILIKKVFQ